VRIAALGDSITFGWRVPIEECFTERLERSLNTAQSEGDGTSVFDVLNFGVSGYSTSDEVTLFEERVVAYAPDLVILGYCFNDPSVVPMQPLPRYFAEVPLWHRSHLFRLAWRTHYRRQVDTRGEGNFYRYLHAPDGPAWATVVDAFGRLRDAAADLATPVLVVIFPNPETARWEGYPYEAIHAQIAAAAAEQGFHVVDLLEVYRQHDPFTVIFSPTDRHPTSLGHALAARELHEPVLDLLTAR
jgi:lysophospholipase L1-like esterase